VRHPRQLLADVVDVALEFGIVVDAHLPANLGVLLLPNRQFFGFAQERHLSLAGHRIRGARRRGYEQGKKEAGP
jgi:hypothetical protein